MNITKEQADKVIAALSMNRIMARDENGNYTKEITAQVVVEALSIMRGLAEDTELLALFAASQKQLPLNAAISATSPQAAQTDERNGCLSNCRNCQHFRRDTGGHCYMFKDEPQGVCKKWIASNTFANGFPSDWAGRKG